MLRRRFLVGALAVPVLGLLPGCSARYSDRAQAFVDEVLPGKLELIDVVNDIGGPVPVPTRTAIFRLVNDPDAFVSVDSFDATTLQTAYALALRAAAEQRLLAAAMSAAGFAVLGFAHTVKGGTVGLSCHLQADITEATMARVETDLDAALAAWLSTRSAAADPMVSGTMGSIRVGLIRPDAAADLPELPADQPLLRRLDFKKRNDALAGVVLGEASVHPDDRGRFPPVADRMKPNRGTVSTRGGETAARSAAEQWLGTQRPDLALNGEDLLARRLEPGSMRRARLYFRADEAGTTARVPTHYVAVTFDLETRRTSDVALMRRPATGWPSPLEPEL